MTPGPVPDDVFEEAAAWHARMREPASGPAAAARQAAFERWLSADPRHRLAYDEAERLWQFLEVPLAQGLVVPLDPPRRSLAIRLALAASVLLLLGAASPWYGVAFDRLRSDHATPVGKRASVPLEDGSTLLLGSDTAVALDFDAGRRRVRLFRGEAWFEVKPDGNQPFIVSTGWGRSRWWARASTFVSKRPRRWSAWSRAGFR